MVNAKISDASSTQVYAAEPVNQGYTPVYTYEQQNGEKQDNYNDNVPPSTSEPPVVTGVYPNANPTSKDGKKNYVHITSRHPVMISYCPQCKTQEITTRTKTKSSDATCVAAIVGLIICWPLVFVPFCVKSMKQTNHYCPHCDTKVGRVKAFH